MADVQYVTLYLAGSPVTAVAGSVLHSTYLQLGATSAPAPSSTTTVDVYPQYITATELAAALAAYTPGSGSSGLSVTDNGDGTYDLAGTAVTDNGDGTYLIAA